MISNHIKHILYFIFFVTIVGCASQPAPLTKEEKAFSADLREKFEPYSQLVYAEDTLLASNEVLAYYNANEYAPIWTHKTGLTPPGEAFYTFLGDAQDYGFYPEMFHHSLIGHMKDSSLTDTEMLMTNAFFLYTTHIHLGCIDSNYSYIWKKDSLSFSLPEQLDRVRNGESAEAVITSHQPQFWDYLQLQKGLAHFLDSFALDTSRYEIPRIKDDSVACYEAAKIALLGHAFLDSADMENDSIFLIKLKDFQLANGLKDDAVVGKWTGRALEKSNYDRFLQAALSLEKWRWKKAYPERYIRVNIPEFALYFVDKDSILRKHRVVVGAYKTQTPEFSATMMRMVTNPFWHVPYSISSTEILYGARKDSAYFAKKGYKVFKNGERVDPTGVDWSSIGQSNFPYRVRQDGGGGNSLGRIKFLFPNVHSVFIHDTPSKRLFGNDVRAYSHGCVRLHEPFDLAKSILTADGHKVEPDTLDNLVKRGAQRVIELNEPFEVFIEYITATADSAESIRFHPDIYGRDEKYLVNSFKKFNL